MLKTTNMIRGLWIHDNQQNIFSGACTKIVKNSISVLRTHKSCKNIKTVQTGHGVGCYTSWTLVALHEPACTEDLFKGSKGYKCTQATSWISMVTSLPAVCTLNKRLNKIHEEKPSSGRTAHSLFCSGFKKWIHLELFTQTAM